MTRLLVAEDSPTQTVQIRGLLESASYEVETVENGKAALRRLEAGDTPDLVLTDMMMPEMDGLQLVRAIRVHYSGIPVILMTAQGTDSIAIEALEDGAAGYVPKSQLNEMLLYQIERVLHAAHVDRTYDRLLMSLERNELEFKLENDARLIDPLVELLQQMAHGVGICDSTRRVQLGMAIEHALLNAIYRGNLEISPADMRKASELLIRGEGESIIEQRQRQSPHGDRRVHVHAVLTRDKAQFTIRDEGKGFDTAAVLDLASEKSIGQSEGQGLVLMRTFMDDVAFNDIGNEVTLTISREPQ